MRELDPARWEEVQRLFHLALGVPPADRARVLSGESDDSSLIAAVMALLEADAAEQSPLDADVGVTAMAVLEERHAPGRRLGPYVLGDLIGEGGSALVYQAHRGDLGNTVAIKILRDAWVSPARRRRFSAEQRTLAVLTHPAIARLLDADTLQDGTPYFVMEHVQGVPVTLHCAERDLPVRDRVRLIRSVCEAVQHAHARAIVHRDIKPSNVLVTADGAVKLLDFGIAKQLEDPEVTSLTGTAARPMTPAYAAPEQLRGEPVGVYTDVYALGALLYEVLTGIRPAGPVGTEASAAVGRQPARPSELMAGNGRGGRGRLWADVDSLCLTALHEEPARRYRSVEALIRDIDHLLNGEPLDARPDTLAWRAGRFVQRNRRALAGVLLAVTLLAALSATSAVRLAGARDRAALEAAKARAVADYLIDLFEAGDPYIDDGEADVRTLLERGEARVEALAAQPALQAELLAVLGRVRLALSDYERAEPLLERALATQRTQRGDDLAVASTLMHLGRLHFHTGRFDEAHAYLSEALQVRQRRLPAGHPDVAEALDELGVITSSRGDYVTADTLFRSALLIRNAVHATPHADLGVSLNNVAVNEFNLGRFDSAGVYYERALDVERATYGTDHPSIATTLANYGKLHEQAGRYAEAESLLTEALRIRRARLGDEHYETALSLSQLGGLLEQAGEMARAETYLREALAVRERTLGPAHPGVGTTLNSIGLLLLRRGDAGAATSAFRRVVEIYGTALGPEHRFTGVAHGNLGAALQAAGNRTAAEAAYRRSVGILAAVHPPGHPELAWNEARLGILLAERRRDAEAEPLLRQAHDALLAAHGVEHQRTSQAAAALEDVSRRLRR